MNELSKSESDFLQVREAVIERTKDAFLEAGNALLEIRDDPRKVYRKYGTFEDYLKTRWGWSRRHGYRMIEAASVVDDLCPIGHIPENLEQTRPLAPLDSDERREAWSRATEEYGQPTAAQVKATVDEMFPRREPLNGQGNLFDEAPKSKEPDHDSIGESWIKIVNDNGIVLTSIDRRGGVAKLIENWPIDRQWGFVSASERSRDQWQEIVNQAKEVIQCQDNGNDRI